jgi:hypothetical protein
MITSKDDDNLRDFDTEHPQQLLIAAYRRLMQLPRQADGMRFTPITTTATWELRLIDLLLPRRADKRSLWVELFDLTTGRSIDSRGCQDLNEAGAATRYFLAYIQHQHTESD